MLVLSRKENESIQLGDDVTITILQAKGGKTRVGIKAPRDLKVVRTELLKKPTATEENDVDRMIDAA